MALTGKFEFRKTLRGKVVLQVEEEVKPFWSKAGALKRRWRDATQRDLSAPEIRVLIDTGLKPWLGLRAVLHRGITLDGAAQNSALKPKGEPRRMAH